MHRSSYIFLLPFRIALYLEQIFINEVIDKHLHNRFDNFRTNFSLRFLSKIERKADKGGVTYQIGSETSSFINRVQKPMEQRVS